MSYERRLQRLERLQAAQDRAYLARLSDAELAALAGPPDPAYERALTALSDDELDRVLDGQLDRADVLRRARD